nr:alpha/beta hydrolase [uncultured Pedobacter sp.]
MKKNIIVLLLMCVGLFANAQEPQVIHLWPNNVPNEPKAKHPAEVTADKRFDIKRLTNITDPLITIYQPSSEKNNGVGIMVCPGGGYAILAIDAQGEEVAEWLNSLGYTAFVLQYRVPNKQAGALQDIQRAMRIVRSKSSALHIDSTKIGVLGFSAGASLCARLSTEFDKITYPAVDKIDALSCRPTFAMLIWPAFLDLGTDHTLTPELTITQKTPPMFLFQTADDSYGNNSLVMTKALREAKIPVELHYYPFGGHGNGLRKGDEARGAWPKLADNWLQRMVLSNRIFKVP